MLHYYLIIGTVSLWTGLCIPLTIIGKLIDGKGHISHKVGSIWAWGVLKISSVKLEIEGSDNIDQKGQYIFIANHTSAFDIPSIYWGIKNKLGMLAKKQLKYVPFFGWAMWAAGHYFVDRKNHRAALAVMEQVALQMQQDKSHSLVIFAEGTRSVDGQLQRFKKGAFILSLETGIPIVPVIINGAYKAKHKKEKRIRATTIQLKILPPMDPKAYDVDTRQAYINDAERLFKTHYEAPAK